MKLEREAVFEKSKTKDTASYATAWWLFGKPRQELRPALAGLARYIATVETTKHRSFQFLDSAVLPDNMLVAVASDDAYVLGVLSSRVHSFGALPKAGPWRMTPLHKVAVFRSIPVPCGERHPRRAYPRDRRNPGRASQASARRTPRPAANALYNVSTVAGGPQPGRAQRGRKARLRDGLVLILKELHDKLNAAVADAYGWPVELPKEEILARLVALNRERAKEETRGLVRWLRPEYQVPRYGSAQQKVELDLVGGEIGTGAPVKSGARPAFPSDDFGADGRHHGRARVGDRAAERRSHCGDFRTGRKVRRRSTQSSPRLPGRDTSRQKPAERLSPSAGLRKRYENVRQCGCGRSLSVERGAAAERQWRVGLIPQDRPRGDDR